MPNAGRTGKADRARPERHGPSAYHIRFIFAQASRGNSGRRRVVESSRLKRTDETVFRTESRDRASQAPSFIGVHRPESSAVTLAFDAQIKLHPISLCRQAELSAG
jgi:hypothetical protein